MSVTVKVGNTYNRIPKRKASRSNCGQHLKVHDWTLFCEVTEGNVNLIHKVVFELHKSFDPRRYVRTLPPFTTRQQSYGAFTALVYIYLSDGRKIKISHELAFVEGGSSQQRKRLLVNSSSVIPPPLKLTTERTFGVELELTVSGDISLDLIARQISLRAGSERCHRASYGSATSLDWKVVKDSSIQCNQNMPNCNTFELVSPILRGGRGLNRLNNVLTAITNVASITVNKSAGMHVHIDVSDLNVFQLCKISKNFIKYERVMDSMMPPSRRNNTNTYIRSNRRNRKLFLLTLAMNPGDTNGNRKRYYKLNFQPLVQRRQSTIEFRQHSGTSEYKKVANWIRFTIAFISNSATLRAPQSFSATSSDEKEFNALFNYVIKDRYLKDFYDRRIRHLQNSNSSNDSCCTGCSTGHGSCES
eukprot:GSMAST32.ASY1.ANO1.216.1 assembled CDS